MTKQDEDRALRAALVAIGYIYEDDTRPLSDGMKEIALRLVEERNERNKTITGTCIE